MAVRDNHNANQGHTPKLHCVVQGCVWVHPPSIDRPVRRRTPQEQDKLGRTGRQRDRQYLSTMKQKKQPVLDCPLDYIVASAHPMVAFSGFYESHDPPLLASGDARSIVPPHAMAIKTASKVGTCCIVLIVTLAAAGAIRSK